MLELVEDYNDVIKNTKEFHEAIETDEDLIKKLSLFRHWYYVDEVNGFAPSKFIGYKNITSESYKMGTTGRKAYMDGRDTVRKLKQWFRLINQEDFESYYKKLELFLAEYDKKPNKKTQIYYNEF